MLLVVEWCVVCVYGCSSLVVVCFYCYGVRVCVTSVLLNMRTLHVKSKLQLYDSGRCGPHRFRAQAIPRYLQLDLLNVPARTAQSVGPRSAQLDTEACGGGGSHPALMSSGSPHA